MSSCSSGETLANPRRGKSLGYFLLPPRGSRSRRGHHLPRRPLVRALWDREFMALYSAHFKALDFKRNYGPTFLSRAIRSVTFTSAKTAVRQVAPSSGTNFHW